MLIGNLDEYFAVEERPLVDIPEAAYLEVADLIGQYAQGGVDAGSIITEKMFGELQAKQKDAVLLGVNMEALEQSVAGTLRAGDVIDIYTVKVEEDKSVTVNKQEISSPSEESVSNSEEVFEEEHKEEPIE